MLCVGGALLSDLCCNHHLEQNKVFGRGGEGGEGGTANGKGRMGEITRVFRSVAVAARAFDNVHFLREAARAFLAQ